MAMDMKKFNPSTLVGGPTCSNCYFEHVERKKSDDEPCRTCLATGTPENRFPKHKWADEGTKGEEAHES